MHYCTASAAYVNTAEENEGENDAPLTESVTNCRWSDMKKGTVAYSPKPLHKTSS